jgi:hypothetical protein
MSRNKLARIKLVLTNTKPNYCKTRTTKHVKFIMGLAPLRGATTLTLTGLILTISRAVKLNVDL